ncbi:MAG: response regulator [Anaerolineales bacterium]|nr:response regulator [Anaerolineales bacterium]
MALLPNNVVLAEDDPEISSMVKDYFEQAYGLSVATTDKVDEIIPLVLKTKASVLIMDLELKDGDASQVVSDVADIEGLVVIILTGTWKGREENKLLKDGAQVVMRKPQKPSTIWQQVLNLRGTTQKTKEAPQRIWCKKLGGYYDVQDGVIVTEGGKRIYLSDKKRDIMDVLAERLASEQRDNKDDENHDNGWVIREEMIRSVFGEMRITGDLMKSYWYYLREVKKTLDEWLGEDKEIEVIENKRVGRSDSYYRLNPEIFSWEQPSKEEGQGA